jgi:hypothetical protein
MTPSARTKAYLVERGYSVALVERYIRPNPRAAIGFRKDAYGIIDYLAIRPGEILGVQSCGTDFSGHLRKLQAHNEIAALWISSGAALELIGWRKLKSGWEPRVQRFSLSDFPVTDSGP